MEHGQREASWSAVASKARHRFSELAGSKPKRRRRCALPAHSKTWRLGLALGFFILHSAFCLRLWGQYSIDWSTIDAGVGTSTSAVYTITGTIGQPDAAHSASANYTLDGGFWSILAVQTPGAPYLWVTRTTTNTVCVWWGVSGTSWQLQATNSLARPGSGWTACSYCTNGANCVYVESPPTGSRFYRLKQP